jgi:alpha-beta hydrolase superfamily lysophospholipase
MMHRPRRHWLFLFLLDGFSLMHVVAFFHAWRFTHFTNEPGTHSANPEQLSAGQKAWLLLTGIRNPKPQNGSARPAFPFQDVSISSPNGRLAAWFGPADSVARGTVALFHGYTSNKSKLVHEATLFHQMGYNILLVDFAGNGDSKGYRTTVGYREAYDVKAAVDWLKHNAPGTAQSQPVLYGVSMGAVAIMRAEAELGVQASANIVECPYGSMRQTAYNRFHSMHLPGLPLADLLVFWGGVQNGFWAFGLKAEDYARHISTPTLLLWGTADPRVARAETDAIFAHLAGSRQRHDFVGVGHEPYWHRYPAEWESQIQQFIQ